VIASIEGTIGVREGNRVVVLIGGVGLEILVPMRTLDSIGTAGERVRFETYLHVREDALTLYGFIDENEKRMFQALLGVSGIGPKVALGILSVSSAGEVAAMIHGEQASALQSCPGVGRKTAERIVLELKDRIDIERYSPGAPKGAPRGKRELVDEAVSALVTLGVSKIAAEKAVLDVLREDHDPEAGVENIVREALKTISVRGT
jgi:Holliday junction DNA helicase RuvA